MHFEVVFFILVLDIILNYNRIKNLFTPNDSWKTQRNESVELGVGIE